jgi:methylglyoxal synthase
MKQKREKMKNVNNLFPVKRIAVVASDDKRKELIEWSYFNRDILSNHELIATYSTANLLEGTVNRPVYKIPVNHAEGYQQLYTMIQDKKVDVIFFFENPMKTERLDDSMLKLLDIALEMNIVIASNGSRLDFMSATA